MKQTGTSTTYDGTQTGCDGSIHLELKITRPSTSNDEHSNGEDTIFIFTPILDEEMEGSLIEMFPDCLNEGIAFKREMAQQLFHLRLKGAAMTQNKVGNNTHTRNLR